MYQVPPELTRAAIPLSAFEVRIFDTPRAAYSHRGPRPKWHDGDTYSSMMVINAAKSRGVDPVIQPSSAAPLSARDATLRAQR